MKHLHQFDHLLPGEQEIPLSWLEDFKIPEVEEDEIEAYFFEELNFD